MKPGGIVYQGKIGPFEKITIRHVQESDTAEMLRFVNTLSKEKTFITFQGEQITLEDEDKYVKKRVDKFKNHEGIQLLVFLKNRLIANSSIDLHEKINSHVGNFGIMVEKKYRGFGIGNKLLDLTISQAKKELPGLKIITLEVFANNPNAIALYKKKGFTEHGLLPKGVKHRNKYIDEIYMFKSV